MAERVRVDVASPTTPLSFSSGPKPRLAAIPSERPGGEAEEEEELLRVHLADHVGADKRSLVAAGIGQQVAIGAEGRRRSVVEDQDLIVLAPTTSMP